MRKSLLAILLLSVALIRADAAPPFNAFQGTIARAVVPVTNASILAIAEPAFVTPADNPSLPAWVDTFAPTFTGASSGSAPFISRMTVQADRSQSVSIAGYQLSSTNVNVYGQSSSVNQAQNAATILTSDGNRLACQLPNGLPSGAGYLCWLSNGSGYGNTYFVNHTESWYLVTSSRGTTQGTAGDTVSVIGRNLLHPADNNCYVYLQPTGSTGVSVSTTSVNPYRVQFTIPGGLSAAGTSTTSVTAGTGSKTFTTATSLGYPAGQTIIVRSQVGTGVAATMTGTVTSDVGTSLVLNVASITGSGTTNAWFIDPTYQVWLHNGRHAKYGWSQCPDLLEITQSVDSDYAGTTYTMGAPSGGTDTAAFNTATAALGGIGGNTIDLGSNRTYLLGTTPNQLTGSFGSAVRLKGVNVTIKPTGSCTGGHLLNFIPGSELNGVTIDATGFGDQFTSDLTNVSRLVNSTLIYQSISSNAYSDIVPNGGNGYIKGSTITGNGYFSNGNTTTYCDSSIFKATNSTGGCVTVWGTQRFYCNGNTFQDLNSGDSTPNSTSRGGGRAVIIAAFASCYNIYCGGNTVSMSLVSGDNNSDGEQFLLEDGNNSGVEPESVASATVTGGVTVLTLGALSSDRTGYDVWITAGKGEAQFAHIASANVGAKTLTLDRQLTVTPDVTSKVDIVLTASRCVVYNNSQTGGQYHNSQFNQFCGGCDVIDDNNRMSGAQYGLSIWGQSKANGGGSALPCCWNLIQNNTISSIGFTGVRMVSAVEGTNSEAIGLLGNTVRGNSLTNLSTSSYGTFYSANGAGSLSDINIIESDTFNNEPTGFHQDTNVTPSSTATVTLLGSTYMLGTATFSGSIAHDNNNTQISIVNSGTTFNGFQN